MYDTERFCRKVEFSSFEERRRCVDYGFGCTRPIICPRGNKDPYPSCFARLSVLVLCEREVAVGTSCHRQKCASLLFDYSLAVGARPRKREECERESTYPQAPLSHPSCASPLSVRHYHYLTSPISLENRKNQAYAAHRRGSVCQGRLCFVAFCYRPT